MVKARCSKDPRHKVPWRLFAEQRGSYYEQQIGESVNGHGTSSECSGPEHGEQARSEADASRSAAQQRKGGLSA